MDTSYTSSIRGARSSARGRRRNRGGAAIIRSGAGASTSAAANRSTTANSTAANRTTAASTNADGPRQLRQQQGQGVDYREANISTDDEDEDEAVGDVSVNFGDTTQWQRQQYQVTVVLANCIIRSTTLSI